MTSPPPTSRTHCGMGSFFTNVQVKVSGRAAAKATEAVADSLRRLAKSQGYVEATDGDNVHRSIAVHCQPDTGWISVYDDATEDQELEPLWLLARRLSSDLKTNAVSVLVHDSDLLELALFKNGRRSDRFSNAPDYFEPVPKKQMTALAGRSGRWKPLLVDSATPAALENAFQQGNIDAEGVLTGIARLLGWSIDACMTGHNYLDEADLETTSMKFRMRQPSPEIRMAAGPVRLRLHASASVYELACGEAVELTLTLLNTGGEAKGLGVMLWGPALNDGLVEVDKVIVSPTLDPDGKTGLRAPLSAVTTDLGPAWFVGFRDFELHAAPVTGDPFKKAPGRTFEETMRLWNRCQWRLAMEGRAAKVGRAQLCFAVMPRDEDPDARAAAQVDVDVRPAPRQPLHVSADVSPSLLRRLEDPRVLFALCELASPQEECAPVVAEAIELWHEIIAGGSKVTYGIASVEKEMFSPRLRRMTVTARGLRASRKWASIKEQLKECLTLSAGITSSESSVTERDRGGQPVMNHSSGFCLDSSAFHTWDESAPSTLQLALWFSVENTVAERVREAIAALRGIIDTVVAGCDALQAVVGRWDWRPTCYCPTLYEQACGVDDNSRQTGDWGNMFLRAVTGDGMWLGPKLMRRLKSRRRLAALAEVTKIGKCTRLVPHPTTTLDELERALAGILHYS